VQFNSLCREKYARFSAARGERSVRSAHLRASLFFRESSRCKCPMISEFMYREASLLRGYPSLNFLLDFPFSPLRLSRREFQTSDSRDDIFSCTTLLIDIRRLCIQVHLQEFARCMEISSAESNTDDKTVLRSFYRPRQSDRSSAARETKDKNGPGLEFQMRRRSDEPRKRGLTMRRPSFEFRASELSNGTFSEFADGFRRCSPRPCR